MRKLYIFFILLTMQVVAISQNLVAYYPFNGNANDQSGNSINPTYIGTGVTLTTDRFGNPNSAYNFDGATGSYMRMPADLLPTTNRTVSLWFNVPDVTNRPGLLGYGGNGCGTTLLMGLNCTGSGQYWVQGHCGTNAAAYSYPTAPVNNWYHWVLTINGSTQKIYVNGELKTSTNSFSGSTFVSGRDLALGVITSTSGTAPYTDVNVGYLNGKLDDVCIYDDAMTDVQVQNLYNNESIGLVAYYPFNGNANDESGNGNNATVNGASLTEDRNGAVNSAYDFNGSNWMQAPANPVLSFGTGDFSITSFIKVRSVGTCRIVSAGYQAEDGIWGLGFGSNVAWGSGLRINYGVYNGGTYRDFNSNEITNYTVGQWAHVAVTKTGSTLIFYFNGQQVGTASISYVSNANSYLSIGCRQYGPNTQNELFNGKIDELRIYKRALSAYEIMLQAKDGLIAYYPFNGNASDESGNGYNGTVSGATLAADRFNQSGRAYNFVYNGVSSDKIQVPGTDALNFSTGGFALSAWVQFSGTAGAGNNYPIVSKHICSEQSGYILMLYNDKLTFWLAGAGGYNTLSTPDNYTDGKWHQVVGVYDGTTQYIYVDGVLKSSAALTYAVFNIANWALGGYNGCNGGFNGKVDEIKIYGKPLDASEVQAMYTKSDDDLIAWYPSNGNSNDESGNMHHGTVTEALLTTDRNGVTDKAYQFDGVNDKITAPEHPDWSFGNGDFSITSWVNVSTITTGRIVSAGYDANDGIWGLGFGNNIGWGSGLRINYFVYSNNAYRDFNSTEITNYSTGQWAFVGVTKKGNLLTFYFNGQPAGTEIVNYVCDANSFLSIGTRQTTAGNMVEFFNGKIDEVRIYKRALFPNEILQLADIPLLPNLLAYYPLNGNANDMSGNSRNGTSYGGAALTTDKYANSNSAYSFDGAASGITLANTTSLDFIGGAFTLSAWVKYSNITGVPVVIVGKHNCGTPTGYFLGVENNIFRFWMASGGNWSTVQTSEAYNDNKWHHVVGTFDGTNQRLYVDGIMKNGTSLVYNTPATGASILIGDKTGACAGGIFNGSIDEVKIYDSPLNAKQVLALYLENRGSGNALLFNGSTTNRVDAGLLSAVTEFSVEAWVKRNSSASAQYILSGKDADSWGVGLSDNTMGIYKMGSAAVYSNPVSIDDNKWHHLAYTLKNDIAKFYVDGAIVGSGILPSRIVVASTYSIGGRDIPGNAFDGAIDEVRVWGVELQPDTIRKWMNRKITPAHPLYDDMARYYNFDETNINLAYDLRNGATGTLIDGPAFLTSGAPIGDTCTYDFVNSTRLAGLLLTTGESFTATASQGNPSGLSVYEVKDPPNTITGTLGAEANDHYFGVHVSGGTAPQYTAVYDYTGNKLVSPATEQTLQLFKRNDNSATTWANSGAILDINANTLTLNGQNTEYILGSSGFGLPVTLLNLQVSKTNTTTARLSWQTTTEVNNLGFQIQRSFDGNYYTDIQFVNSAGNSSDTREYSITDIPGRNGRVFYRLKQVDFDSNNKLSNIVSVLFDKQGLIKVYPNPALDQVTIEGIENFSRVQVLDGTGKLLRDISNKQQYQLNIDLSGIKNGFYIIRLMNEKESQTLKLVIGQ